MKNLVILLLFVIVLAVGAPEPIRASDPVKCTAADVIKKAAALKSTGDNKKDMDALIKLSADISAANIACNGMTWYGQGSVLTDPFDIAPGIYRFKLTPGKNPPKTFWVDITNLEISDNCYAELTLDHLVAQLDASKGCHVDLAIAPGNEKADWTVTLELLK